MIGVVSSAFFTGLIWNAPDLSTWARAVIGAGCLIAVFGFGYCISYSEDCLAQYKRDEQERIDNQKGTP